MEGAAKTLEKPQIICHNEKSLTFSVFDGKWIPCSAKFVVIGSKPKGNGIIQIYELTSGESSIIKEVEKEIPFKCCTFGATTLTDRYMATGDFTGNLDIWNLENLKSPVFHAEAHDEIINCIDGVGGQSVGCGPPEIVTGSRDGMVKLWDPRQKEIPVAVMEPTDLNQKRDCWSVAIGNSYNNHERVICAGYDNGDIKMFDLRKMNVRWETNVKNGVCSVQFDRKEIEMNKLVATTLESKFFVYDLRTQHPKKGFTYLREKAHSSTIWAVSHLPQNREIFMTCGGNGSLYLWHYNYPDKRWTEDSNGDKRGVIGSISLLQNCFLTSQPISTFHWSPDKIGLAIATSFDQSFKVVIVTKLNLY